MELMPNIYSPLGYQTLLDIDMGPTPVLVHVGELIHWNQFFYFHSHSK